jgi:hypothetical protein
MTVFQLNRPQTVTWTQPTDAAVRIGRHASALRAKSTLRRMFYAARHAAH